MRWSAVQQSTTLRCWTELVQQSSNTKLKTCLPMPSSSSVPTPSALYVDTRVPRKYKGCLCSALTYFTWRFFFFLLCDVLFSTPCLSNAPPLFPLPPCCHVFLRNNCLTHPAVMRSDGHDLLWRPCCDRLHPCGHRACPQVRWRCPKSLFRRLSRHRNMFTVALLRYLLQLFRVNICKVSIQSKAIALSMLREASLYLNYCVHL